jgi:hypothetical protein
MDNEQNVNQNTPNTGGDGANTENNNTKLDIDAILAKDEKTEDDLNALATHAKKLEETNKQLFERAKKAEDKAKTLKTETKDENINNNNQPVGLTREEAILIAKGTDERIINEAAIIAKAKGINILEAVKDPLIEAYADKLAQEEKKRRAQLGASGGAGSSSNDDLTQRVGMSREEHKKAIGM